MPASWADVKLKSNGHVNGNGHHANGNASRVTNGITNGVYLESTDVPMEFLETIAVRTVYGLIPLKLALDWPVFASYDELSLCAAWMGGRIPTFEETRSIYAYSEHLKQEEAEKTLGKTVPAVNG